MSVPEGPAATAVTKEKTTDLGERFESPLGERAPGRHATLGYWLGTLSPSAPALRSRDALGLGVAMCLQYEAEDQADRTGLVFAWDAESRRAFEPVAAIQPTDGWSPLFAAIERLGAPVAHDLACAPGRLAAALARTPAQVAAAAPNSERGGFGDLGRFLELVAVTILRARRRARGAQLVVRPGWSYASVPAPSPRLREAWSRAGFAAADRRPRPGDALPPVGRR